MDELNQNNSRSAINRAKYFLGLARGVPATDRERYEAYIEASIVFARSALHRLHTQFRAHPQFKVLWDSLLNDEAVNFFRLHRDRILKEAPPSLGQKIMLDGEAKCADDLYFFEADVPATQTLAKYLDRLDAIYQRCFSLEKFGFDIDDDIPFDAPVTDGEKRAGRAIEAYSDLRRQKFEDGKQCFYCAGTGEIGAGVTCTHCRGLGYLG